MDRLAVLPNGAGSVQETILSGCIGMSQLMPLGWAVMAGRTVLTRSGPSRLARITGVLGRGNDGSLVLDTAESRIPIVVIAPHAVLDGPALLANPEGSPVVFDGDRVELVGGFGPEGHPHHRAFFASRVSVLDT